MGTNAFTVVNRFVVEPAAGPRGAAREIYVKKQCMHCLDPACASACPVRALRKSPEGAVIYDEALCIGCRYCMVACPFGVPKYEYESRVPRVRKCTFCQPRLRQGKRPACVEACPSMALSFGTRAAMLEEARRRAAKRPPGSTFTLYGEHEAGGTSWLYLTPCEPKLLGLGQVRKASYAAFTRPAMAALPAIILAGPPLLVGIRAFARRRKAVSRAADVSTSADTGSADAKAADNQQDTLSQEKGADRE